MTDAEMKKVFDRLLRDENDLNETEIAIAMLTAMAMDKKHQVEKARTVASER